jgi:hypothetical protein
MMEKGWVFGLEFNYVKAFKAALKTGTNLVAHLFSDVALRDSAFDQCRSVLLECPEPTRPPRFVGSIRTPQRIFLAPSVTRTR